MLNSTLGVARKFGAKAAAIPAAAGALVLSSPVMAQEADSWTTQAATKAAENGVAVVAVIAAIALAGLAIWGAKWGARKLGFM